MAWNLCRRNRWVGKLLTRRSVPHVSKKTRQRNNVGQQRQTKTKAPPATSCTPQTHSSTRHPTTAKHTYQQFRNHVVQPRPIDVFDLQIQIVPAGHIFEMYIQSRTTVPTDIHPDRDHGGPQRMQFGGFLTHVGISAASVCGYDGPSGGLS